MYNIFQGNSLIEKCIVESLGLDTTKEADAEMLSQNFYFQAFFYLTKRFGPHKVIDEHKDAGSWDFNVKGYRIRILIDSTFVRFMMFGNPKFMNYPSRTPFSVATWRAEDRVGSGNLFTEADGISLLTDSQQATNQKVWEAFCLENGIDDSWSEDRFNDSGMSRKWFYYVINYNLKVLGVDYLHYKNKYGLEYRNRHVNHALRTLRQFLHNMLTPIWVRDCAFNILGRGGEEYEKYADNIAITRTP